MLDLAVSIIKYFRKMNNIYVNREVKVLCHNAIIISGTLIKIFDSLFQRDISVINGLFPYILLLFSIY